MNTKSLSTFCAFAILAAAVLGTLKPEAQAGDFCHRPRVFAQRAHHNFHYGHHGHYGALNLQNPYGFHYDLAKVYVSVGEELIAEAAEERLLRRLEARRAVREALSADQTGNLNETAPYASPLADSKVQSLFNTRCKRCHSGDESRIDLTNADALTPPQRASVAVQVDLGLMPKGGQRLSSEDTLLLKLWAAGKVDANGREL